MKETDQFSAVIFDLGNVVLNWDIEGIVQSLDVSSEESARVKQELFDHQHWVDLDHGKVTEDAVTAEITKRTSISASTIRDAMLAAKTTLSVISPTRQLMDEIASSEMPMYCLSNMSRETYAHIKEYEFFELFSGIVISGHEECMKPDKEIYNRLLQRFELEPSATLFIDDSEKNIEAAEALGIGAFHFKRTRACYAQLRQMLFG